LDAPPHPIDWWKSQSTRISRNLTLRPDCRPVAFKPLDCIDGEVQAFPAREDARSDNLRVDTEELGKPPETADLVRIVDKPALRRPAVVRTVRLQPQAASSPRLSEDEVLDRLPENRGPQPFLSIAPVQTPGWREISGEHRTISSAGRSAGGLNPPNGTPSGS
jgi:hypothetical protein